MTVALVSYEDAPVRTRKPHLCAYSGEVIPAGAKGTRREKRENLRHTVNDTLGSLSLQQRLAAIMMTEHGSWLGVMRGLADLIDRPTTHNLSELPGFACELCGAVWPYDLGFTHCPECGAEVVDE